MDATVIQYLLIQIEGKPWLNQAYPEIVSRILSAYRRNTFYRIQRGWKVETEKSPTTDVDSGVWQEDSKIQTKIGTGDFHCRSLVLSITHSRTSQLFGTPPAQGGEFSPDPCHSRAVTTLQGRTVLKGR